MNQQLQKQRTTHTSINLLEGILGTRDGNTVWQVLVIYPFVALWMAWFAWFIKKQEESSRD